MPRQFILAFFSLLIVSQSPPLHAAAEPIVVDFDTLPRGAIVEDQYAAQGVLIHAVNWSHGPDRAVIFDTRNISASDDEDIKA